MICSSADAVVYDAMVDEAADAVLAEHFAAATSIERPQGRVRFHWEPGAGVPAAHPRVRTIGVEQSNTSIVLDERLVLKVFRRIQPGINPELEMLRFLATHDFFNIAALAGWYGYSGELMDATLGVVQPFIEDARDGWDLALDALAEGDAGFLDRLGRLGSVTGRMHAVLASDSGDPDFAPEEPTVEMLSLLSATLDEQIERLFDELPGDVPAIAQIAGRGEEVRGHLQSLSHVGVGGRLIRIHGDYHLGQTVHGPEDWIVLDFEGEPGRPLVERRRKRSPLRDVAGMLRSFAYAASAVSLLRGCRGPRGLGAGRARALPRRLHVGDRPRDPAGRSERDLEAARDLRARARDLRAPLRAQQPARLGGDSGCVHHAPARGDAGMRRRACR